MACSCSDLFSSTLHSYELQWDYILSPSSSTTCSSEANIVCVFRREGDSDQEVYGLSDDLPEEGWLLPHITEGLALLGGVPW